MKGSDRAFAPAVCTSTAVAAVGAASVIVWGTLLPTAAAGTRGTRGLLPRLWRLCTIAVPRAIAILRATAPFGPRASYRGQRGRAIPAARAATRTRTRTLRPRRDSLIGVLIVSIRARVGRPQGRCSCRRMG